MFEDTEVYTNILDVAERFNIQKYGGVGNFFAADGEGRLFGDVMRGRPCHYQLHGLDEGSSYLVTAIDMDDKEVLKDFATMLCNESVYSQFIVTHDVSKVVDNGFIVISSDTPRDVLAHICVVSRLTKEFPVDAELMVDLWRAGVPTMLAFVIGHCFRYCGGSYFKVTAEGDHHKAFEPVCFNKDYLRNIIEGNFEHSFPFKDRVGYKNICGVWRGETNRDSWLPKVLNKVLSGCGTGSEYKNPFYLYTKKVDTNSSYTRSEIVSKVVPSLPKIIGDLYEGIDSALGQVLRSNVEELRMGGNDRRIEAA